MRIGLLKPNSAMLAAICATWASEWVRGFLAQGMSFSTSHHLDVLGHPVQVSKFHGRRFFILPREAPVAGQSERTLCGAVRVTIKG
jgi:hypothetical protein